MTKKEIRTIKDTIEVVRREVGKPCKEYVPLCFVCEVHRTVAVLEYFLSLDEELPTIEA